MERSPNLFTEFKSYQTSEIPRGIFKASIVPRPIGWISSVSQSGHHNLAPFSYFNAVCDNPPTIMVSMTDQHIQGGEKDTLKNIESGHGHFVINVVTKQRFQQMNLTSADLLRDEDEFKHANLEWVDSLHGLSRRVKRSPIQIECQYFKSVQLPKANKDVVNRMIIGTVLAMHVDPKKLDDNGRIDYNKMEAIARLGYNDYLVVGTEKVFTSIKPKLEK